MGMYQYPPFTYPPFTDPYGLIGWLWQTLLNEITLSYSENTEPLGFAAYLPGWNSLISYSKDHVVRWESFGNFAYKSLTNDNVNNWPWPGSTHWEVVPIETLFLTYLLSWNIGATYAIGERVRHGTHALYGARFWESLQNNNIGHIPDEEGSTWWKSATAVDIHSIIFWKNFQIWLEQYCAYYYKDYVAFTVAAWRVAAGLNAEGFRRSIDNGATFLYGLIQKGDHIGPWIFEDLQKGFAALTTRRYSLGIGAYEGWVLDNGSGLYWYRYANQSLTHANAITYCAGLGGRLPTIAELNAVVSLYGNPNIANAAGNVVWSEGDAFYGISLVWNNDYWSSNLASGSDTWWVKRLSNNWNTMAPGYIPRWTWAVKD